jgi:DNA-binding LytR/AlgR family response regulator
MNVFNCLIVDDEPIARNIIVNYCSNIPSLHIVSTCENALEAKRILQDHLVHILFLDIHLPVLDGINFLKVLKNPPQVIFTTAYKDYAVNAFDLDACDYLVKPFSLDRFIVAVDKAIDKLTTLEKRALSKSVSEDSYLFIKADGKIYNINVAEVLYAEAKGNYTRIVTTTHEITPNISFTNFEKMLPPILFIRVHRSFIINKSKIGHIEGNRLFINKTEISIGSNYKDSFLKSLGL